MRPGPSDFRGCRGTPRTPCAMPRLKLRGAGRTATPPGSRARGRSAPASPTRARWPSVRLPVAAAAPPPEPVDHAQDRERGDEHDEGDLGGGGVVVLLHLGTDEQGCDLR